ncbi:septum formation inhibitor Maf [Nonlabens ponticola]|uniref:Septum formation inhibitor Maf n=1 Tax=Nonlabens ponticola TaxID=2496866 RepID=A0A3S9MZ61_9FLAO|nr:septum formation inhibitor Maf [Nonlabens ponticola]AZQ44382.1 septum formation inhibitor Maf [Nonlabens ponticola]
MKNLLLLLLLAACIGCETPSENEKNEVDSTTNEVAYEPSTAPARNLSQDFKDYWYAGVAEICSYELNQSRYGQNRPGDAVLIFVTEPFNPVDQVKADAQNDTNRSVLKLNATRNFNTGIYPYTIMSSTFLPLDKQDNAIKVATSIQEWCGHTYMQLNNRQDQYDVMLHSYFQSEGNKEFAVDNVMLENQVPSQLRLDPRSMPIGQIKMIPSTEYLRLVHKETKAMDATASLIENQDNLIYNIKYNDDSRSIAYTVESAFPYKVMSWEETYQERGRTATTTAQLKETLRTAYWSQNSNEYNYLRDSLAL